MKQIVKKMYRELEEKFIPFYEKAIPKIKPGNIKWLYDQKKLYSLEAAQMNGRIYKMLSKRIMELEIQINIIDSGQMTFM